VPCLQKQGALLFSFGSQFGLNLKKEPCRILPARFFKISFCLSVNESVLPICRRKTCNRHAERGAGNIVEADCVAELDRGRVAAVLTADTAVHSRTDFFTQLNRHLHQSADALLVKLCKRVVFVNLGIIVRIQEFARIVTAEAEGSRRTQPLLQSRQR